VNDVRDTDDLNRFDAGVVYPNLLDFTLKNEALIALGLGEVNILFFRHDRARPGHSRERGSLVISL
jgi:hypothetical protein